MPPEGRVERPSGMLPRIGRGVEREVRVVFRDGARSAGQESERRRPEPQGGFATEARTASTRPCPERARWQPGPHDGAWRARRCRSDSQRATYVHYTPDVPHARSSRRRDRARLDAGRDTDGVTLLGRPGGCGDGSVVLVEPTCGVGSLAASAHGEVRGRVRRRAERLPEALRTAGVGGLADGLLSRRLPNELGALKASRGRCACDPVRQAMASVVPDLGGSWGSDRGRRGGHPDLDGSRSLRPGLPRRPYPCRPEARRRRGGAHGPPRHRGDRPPMP